MMLKNLVFKYNDFTNNAGIKMLIIAFIIHKLSAHELC